MRIVSGRYELLAQRLPWEHSARSPRRVWAAWLEVQREPWVEVLEIRSGAKLSRSFPGRISELLGRSQVSAGTGERKPLEGSTPCLLRLFPEARPAFVCKNGRHLGLGSVKNQSHLPTGEDF